MGYWRIREGDWGLDMPKSKQDSFENDNAEWTKEVFAKSIDVRGKSLVDAAKALRRARCTKGPKENPRINSPF